MAMVLQQAIVLQEGYGVTIEAVQQARIRQQRFFSSAMDLQWARVLHMVLQQGYGVPTVEVQRPGSNGRLWFPASVQLDVEAGQVVQQLHAEALLEAFYKAVLYVHAEAHGPQDLRPRLAEVLKGFQELLEEGVVVDHVGCQHVVVVVGGSREPLLQLLAPGQLRHLEQER